MLQNLKMNYNLFKGFFLKKIQIFTIQVREKKLNSSHLDSVILEVIKIIIRLKKPLTSYLSFNQTWLNPPMDGCNCDYITILKKHCS